MYDSVSSCVDSNCASFRWSISAFGDGRAPCPHLGEHRKNSRRYEEGKDWLLIYPSIKVSDDCLCYCILESALAEMEIHEGSSKDTQYLQSEE